jgi:hypothetical protein
MVGALINDTSKSHLTSLQIHPRPLVYPPLPSIPLNSRPRYRAMDRCRIISVTSPHQRLQRSNSIPFRPLRPIHPLLLLCHRGPVLFCRHPGIPTRKRPPRRKVTQVVSISPRNGRKRLLPANSVEVEIPLSPFPFLGLIIAGRTQAEVRWRQATMQELP